MSAIHITELDVVCFFLSLLGSGLWHVHAIDPLFNILFYNRWMVDPTVLILKKNCILLRYGEITKKSLLFTYRRKFLRYGEHGRVNSRFLV